MTICVSTGGPTVYRSQTPSNEILVGTTDGVARLTRSSASDSWTVADRWLAGKHASAVNLDLETGYLFVGTYTDGIFVSLDGGRTWEKRDAGVESEEVYTLHAVRYPEGIRLYAGTEPAHLYASDDLGVTWQELTGVRESASTLSQWTFPGRSTRRTSRGSPSIPDPTTRIYAAIEVGTLMKSTDRGKTWKELSGFEADVHRIAISPAQPDLVYMTNGGGVFRSFDAGENWEQLTDRTSRMRYPDCMIVDPEHPERIVVTSASTPPTIPWAQNGTADAMVALSTDSGQNWQFITNGLPDHIRGNIEGMSMEILPMGRTLVTGQSRRRDLLQLRRRRELVHHRHRRRLRLQRRPLPRAP